MTQLPAVRAQAAMVLALAWVVANPNLAYATACEDTNFCGSNNPCTINNTRTIDPGSLVDCSGRDVTIGLQGVLSVTNGWFTLKANNLTISGNFNKAGKIRAVPGQGAIGGIAIELTGDLLAYGSFHANSDDGGGWITVDADGDIKFLDSVATGIKANGTSSDADGGEIELNSGGDVIIERPLLAEGSGSGQTSGGSIVIQSDGDIDTALGGRMDATGHKYEGGWVELIAEGDVTIGAAVDVFGKGNDGDGGELVVTAGGAITVSDDISVRGGQYANGGESEGGSVLLEAGCGGVNLNADIDTSGGEAGSGNSGGALIIDSIGDVTISGSVTITTASRNDGGDGGDVALRSEGKLTLGSNVLIDASGDDAGNEEGSGASVELAGCEVDLASGATIDVTGYHGGTITFSAWELPPPTGAQPLVISEFSDLRVTNGGDGEDGEIELAVIQTKLGECSSDPGRECTIDTDCTVGCETGDCLYANPDTEGVWAQFVGADPAYVSETSLPSCMSTCP